MKREWAVKSESDTDVVFAEYDADGQETGNFRYAAKSGETVELHVPGLAPRPPRRWPWVAAVATGAVTAGALVGWPVAAAVGVVAIAVGAAADRVR